MIDKHEIQCLQRFKQCDGNCGYSGGWSDVVNHERNSCANLKCKNGCGFKSNNRSDVLKHEDCCDKRMMKQSFQIENEKMENDDDQKLN